jgi:signal transduction histidine kinase
VRLNDITRTTGFRIGLLFLVLFSVTSGAVFAYIYFQTYGYELNLIDSALARRAKVLSQYEPATLIQEVEEGSRNDTTRREPRGLFNANGEHLAGNMNGLPKAPFFDRPFEIEVTNPGGSRRVLRMLVHELPSGQFLALGRDMHDLREFHELLVQAMESGGALVLVLGLLGAAALGHASRRRIDAVTRAIRRIVHGHLSERLPAGGSNDDIDRLAAVVNNMLDELERLMREVKGVSDDVAHDLRTPLTRLLAGLERAERRAKTSEEHAEAIQSATEEARGLLATFNSLLRISEVESGARRQGFTSVDLTRIAQDAVEFFEPLAEENGIWLRLNATKPSELVSGDAQLLFDATCNLVSNALKFTPRDGHVVVETRHVGEEVELAVRDTGPGIPEEERDAVFRRFYRSEKSRHTPGNGLGLSMVAAVAKLHEMKLSVGDAAPGCRISLVGKRVAATARS